MDNAKRPLPTNVGLRELVLDGWFNVPAGELARGLKIRATDTVVDVGCGGGEHSLFCARQGAAVIALDRDAARLAQTEAKLKDSPAHAYRAICTDCDPIPLPDGTADVVICTEVLEHVADPSVILAELVRIARPGGHLLVTVPDARSEQLVAATAPAGYFNEPNHIRVFEPGELRELMLGAGLEIISEQRMGSFWSLYMVLTWLTQPDCETLPLGNPHPITDHWTSLWKELQDYPGGERVRQALNELLPRTQCLVARRPG